MLHKYNPKSSKLIYSLVSKHHSVIWNMYGLNTSLITLEVVLVTKPILNNSRKSYKSNLNPSRLYLNNRIYLMERSYHSHVRFSDEIVLTEWY